MTKKILFTLLFLNFIIIGFAAEIVVTGNYYGFNLYVNNPSVGKDYCVSKVMVNGVVTKDEIRSNAFEIDFSLLNLKIGDPVTVKIVHRDGCTPEVINPKALQKTENVAFSYTKIDKTGKLIWGLTGEMPEDAFVVEQYRWNKWIKLGEVPTSDSVKYNVYAFEIAPHSGVNQFRILRNDANGNPVYSKVVKYQSKTAEITLLSVKVTDKLMFSNETQYEIFDVKGNFITEGFGMEVDISNLEKGKYWVNFDNTTINFTRK